MKALITGINGFIGKHLTAELENAGVKVTGIDVQKGDYGYVADLINQKVVNTIMAKEKPDYIFHLASPILRSDQLIDDTLTKNLQVDLYGTVNLLQSARKLKKRPKVLISGTAAVYKKNQDKPFKETDPLEPKTAYGLSKLTQELIAMELAKSYQIPLVVSRSILLIGPQQAEGFVVNDLVKQTVKIEYKQVKPQLVIGNLNTKRDFTDIRDGVKAYYLLMKKGKPGEYYNVCSGQVTEIKTIVQWLEKNSRVKFEIKQSPKWRKNDLAIIQADNQKLLKLGWQPQYSLTDSLLTILNYWRSELKAF